MIDHKAYIKDAIRTESVITSISMSSQRLSAALALAIAASDILDMVKKEIFYGKEMDADALYDKCQELIDATDFEFMDGEGAPMGDVNSAFTRTLHGAIGKFTEAGEIISAVKRVINENVDLDVVNVAEELGDDQWYNAILCDVLGINMNDAMNRNIAKLKVRFPSAFSPEAALNRDLTAERIILEGQS